MQWNSSSRSSWQPQQSNWRPTDKQSNQCPWCTRLKIALLLNPLRPLVTQLMPPMLACGSESSHKDTKSFGESGLWFFRNKSIVGVCCIEAKRAAVSFFFSVSYNYIQESAIQLLGKQCVDSRAFWTLGPGFNLTVMGVFLYTDKAVGNKHLWHHFYKSLLEQRASYPSACHNCLHSSFTPWAACIWFSRHCDSSILGRINTPFQNIF